MKRRYRNLPPPDGAEYILGEGIVFKPEHDLVNAGKPLPPSVELTPVGPAPTIYEFRPEHDQVRSSPSTTTMSDAEIANRLQLIVEIGTPGRGVRNRILEVGPHSITLESAESRTGEPRTIPFQDIRRRSNTHGCIIDSLRQILGIEAPADKANGDA